MPPAGVPRVRYYIVLELEAPCRVPHERLLFRLTESTESMEHIMMGVLGHLTARMLSTLVLRLEKAEKGRA